MVEGTPPGDALPPPPQRATPARKGARCRAGAGSPRPHRPHPGHTGRGTLAARSRGRAAGGGTAHDTRRPSQRWKALPPGTPFRHSHSEQRRAARGHAVGPVLPPHARTDRTRDTRDAEPWLPAPEDGRPGEGQRLTPGAPHNGGKHPPEDALPPPPRRATPARKGARCGAGAGSPRPHRPHPGHTGRGTLAARSRGRAAGGGTAPDTRRPSQWWKAPPRGRPSATPTASNASPQGRTLWGRRWVPTPAPTAPGTHGTRNPDCPLQRTGGRGRDNARRQAPLTTVESTPPEDALPPPPQRATPARKGARRGAGAGSPRPHQPHPGHTGRGAQAAHSRGRAAGGGTAPDTRRPTKRWQAGPQGTAPHHPRGTQPPQGMQAKGTVLGPHTHTPAPTARGWRTPTARSMGGQSGKGQRLTPDAPHNGGRHPPRGRPSATPTASNASPQGRTLWGRCWVPTPAPTAPGTHGTRNPGCPLQRTGGRGRDSA